MNEVYIYNAGKGESIRLRFGNGHNIWIDSGVSRFAPVFQRCCKEILDSGESLDLLILTHVDDDHIGGVLALLRMGWKCPFQEVRMNGADAAGAENAQLSVRQNSEVAGLLIKQKAKILPMRAGEQFEIGGAKITTFHPDRLVGNRAWGNTPLAYQKDYSVDLSVLARRAISRKDTSINNKNSIVFSFEFQGKRLLFTGDAWSEDIVRRLGEKMQFFDLVKLPHHGAIGNLSEDWKEHIMCRKFLICTDGMMHPDKQTIAKLIDWYGKVQILSPSSWWKRGFFTKNDDRDRVDLVCKEGVVFQWEE